MNAPQDTPEEQGDTYRAKVDEQDGGPGSHDADGGDVNDVASGGVSQRRNEDDRTDDRTDGSAEPSRDGSVDQDEDWVDDRIGEADAPEDTD
ncbi:hypothetical protein [Flexivirga lutea]